MPDQTLTRRKFVQRAAYGGGALLIGGAPIYLSLSGGLRRSKQKIFGDLFSSSWLARRSPVDRTLQSLQQSEFSGDNFSVAHRVLWDKQGFMSGLRVPSEAETERAPLVIIGGGMSGLLTAYLLRDLNPIVLEQAPRFGGNAKAESWRGTDYSLGAAYFVKPDEGGAWDKLLKEIGVDAILRVKNEEDPVSVSNTVYENFWSGASAPGQEGQFRALETYFKNVLADAAGERYPDIPFTGPGMRQIVEAMDHQSFHDHVADRCDGQMHPHIASALEHYCWSTFGASSTEVSAASGLNNYASEFGKTVVAPGGNAGVAEMVLTRLHERLGAGNLRPDSFVVDVKAASDVAGAKDSVEILYLKDGREPRRIRADAVVMAVPKFVAKHVVADLEPQRLSVISKLTYRAYLVANVILKRRPSRRFYDLYMLGDGRVELNDAMASSQRKRATDVISANYAMKGGDDAAVLTLYRAFPFDGGRPLLYPPDAFAKYKKEFERQIADDVLPLLGLNAGDVEGLRVTRWGHPMPVATVGTYAAGVPDVLRKPFRERVFFVEQDNWMLPAIETCSAEALDIAPKVRQFLRNA